MENHKTSPNFSPEVRERALRMMFEHVHEHSSQWSAITAEGMVLQMFCEDALRDGKDDASTSVTCGT
jgi:hypothetical protein